MALPSIHEKPTPKRVAGYLMDQKISHGLNEDIAAMESAYDLTLTARQREDVVAQYNLYAQRVRAMIKKNY